MSSNYAKAFAGVVVGTILVSLVGERIGSYYSDLSSAAETRNQLAEQVLTLTAEEAEGLIVLSSDLGPQSYLSSRCRSDPPQLPAAFAPYQEICRDAALGSILEEQQRNLDVRASHLKAEVLAQRMRTALQEPTASDKFNTLLRGFEGLRQLTSATTCGQEDRSKAAERFSSYPWMTPEATTDLIGSSDPRPCDNHGAAYPAAADIVARGLAFEGDVVRVQILNSSVEGFVDTRTELIQSLLKDPVLWTLAFLGLVAMVVWLLLRGNNSDDQAPPLRVELVPPNSDGESGRLAEGT